MNILAIDTSMAACSVCVLKNKQAFKETKEMERGQAEELIPMINRLMKKANLKFKDLDRIATTIGPGSFTGLRVGLSTAKALSFSCKKKLIGISTLEAIAHNLDWKHSQMYVLLVVIKTKRNDFYVQAFQSDGCKDLSSPKTLTSKEIEKALPKDQKIIVIGDGAEHLINELCHPGHRAGISGHNITIGSTSPFPDTEILAKLSQTKKPTPNVQPLYIKPPNAKIKN